MPGGNGDGRRVRALSWPHFHNHMREEWEPGQHIALIGPTGEGKSTLAVGLLELRRWVIALDPKGEDDTLSASGYLRLREWPPPGRVRDQIAEGYPARLIVGGPSRTDAETARLGQLMQEAVEGVRTEGGWTLYVDEFQLLTDRRMMGVTTQVEQLLISARTRGTSVITAYQAPAWVPRAATRQASFVILWGTRDEDSVKTIAQAMGRPWRELQAMVQQLPAYHVLVIPKRFREPIILTHPPRVGLLPEIRRIIVRDACLPRRGGASYTRRPGMPTRRILEVVVVTTLLMHPIMGLARLWAAKSMLQSQNGTVRHGAAEIIAVVA